MFVSAESLAQGLYSCSDQLSYPGSQGNTACESFKWDLSSSSFLACNSGLHSAIRRHHPPQRAVLSQICCFGEHKVLLFQILLDGAEPRDAGMTQFCLLQSAREEANRILLTSALSSMHIICPNRVSRRNWIIAVRLRLVKAVKKAEFQPLCCNISQALGDMTGYHQRLIENRIWAIDWY